MSEKIIVSVQQLNAFMEKYIANNRSLQQFYIRGEISGHKYYSASGHHYFSLKDSEAQVSCVMYAQMAKSLTCKLVDGLKVVCLARAGFYSRDGKFQIYILSVTPEGQGNLYQAYLQLKKRLEDEGLFAAEHKRPLPLLPGRVAVVTSASGAVIRDIIKVGRRRYPNLDILLFPCNVQGDKAAAEMLAALKAIRQRDDISVIIIGRGGGSMEDLWCFNDEQLAREIYRAKVPVVSAVGHEVDFTIADFVADKRAATPSHAAEMVFPEQKEYLQRINNLRQRQNAILRAKLQLSATKYQHLRQSRYLFRPQLWLAEHFEIIDKLKRRMTDSLTLPLQRESEIFHRWQRRLEQAVNNKQQQTERSYISLYQRLFALNPLLHLQRGYAYISKSNGQKLLQAQDAEIGKDIIVQLADGSLTCLVQDKHLNPADAYGQRGKE